MDSILDLFKLYRGILKKSIDTCTFNNLCTEIDNWFSQFIDIDGTVVKTGKSTSEILDSCFSFFLIIADVVTGFLMEGCDLKQLGINVLLNIISNLLVYEPKGINKASTYVKLEYPVILNYEKFEQFVNKFMPLFPLMIVAKDDININSLNHPYIWYKIGKSYFSPELHIMHSSVAWSKVTFEDSIQYVASYTTYIDLAVYKYIKNRGSFPLEILKWLSVFFENYLIKLNVVCLAIEGFLELDFNDQVVNPIWYQEFSDQSNLTTLKRKSTIQKDPKISICHSLFGASISKNWLQSQSFREPDPHYKLCDEKSDGVNSSLDSKFSKNSISPLDSVQQQAILKDHVNSIQKSVIIRKVTSEQYLDIQHSIVLFEETPVILSACQDLLNSWGVIKISRMLNIFSDILLMSGNCDFAFSTLNLLIVSLKITKILTDNRYINNRYSLSSIMFYEEGLEENVDEILLAQFRCLSTLLCFIGCQSCKKRLTINQGIFGSQKSDLNFDHHRISILRKLANDVIENLEKVSISTIQNYVDQEENYLLYFASLHSLFGCQHMYQIIHARLDHLNLTSHQVVSVNSHRILEEMVLPPLFMKIFCTHRIFQVPHIEEFYIFWNYSLLHYRLTSISVLFAFFSEKIERPCSIPRLKHYMEKPELSVEFRFDDVFGDGELVKRIIRLRVMLYCSFHALILKSSEILLLLSMNISRDMICIFLYEYCYFLSQSNCGVPTPLIKCLESLKVCNNETCSFINFNVITYRSFIAQILVQNFCNFDTLINDLFNKSESKYWIIGAVCCLICKTLTMSISLNKTQKIKSSSENVNNSIFIDFDGVCDSFRKFIFNSNDKLDVGLQIDQQECLNTNSLTPVGSSSDSFSFRRIGSFREEDQAHSIFRIISTWCKIASFIFPIILSRDSNNDGNFVKKAWNDCAVEFTKFLGKLWNFYDSEKLYHFPMWKTGVISSMESYDDLRTFIWTQSSSITLLIVECLVRLSPYLPEDCVEVYFTIFWHLAFHENGLIATYASIGVLILNQLFPRICDYQLKFVLEKNKTCSDLSFKINSINHIWSSRFLVYAIFDRNMINEYTSRAIFALQTPLVGISNETFLTLHTAWNDSVVPSSGLSNSLQEDLKWKENKDFSVQNQSKFEKQSSYLRIKTNISENCKIIEVSANSLCWKRRSRHCYTKVVPADCVEGCYLPKITSQIVRYVYNVILSSPVSNPSQLYVAKCFNLSIQNMLIEDPALTLRYWFEKDLESSGEVFIEIYRLLKCLLMIPSNMSTYLFNAIVAYAKHFMSDMSCISTSFSGVVLHILNIVMPRVQNITFSEFRNCLWMASCETSFLITAHAQSLKNVFLKHGEVTKKVLLSEACTFEHLRNCCLKYFGNENIHTTNNILLIDEKSKKVLDPRLEIMAFYYHKPSASRTVILVYFISDSSIYHGNLLKNISDEVNNTWERFIMLSSVENFSNDETQALQVYSELITKENLISSFTIYTYGLGDTHLLHPVVNVVNTGLTLSCIRFFSSLLREIHDLFSWGDEIRYFLDIYNVTLLMCPDNSLLLRTWIAAVLDLSIIMKDTFSLKGFTFILPTMLRVYSNSNQSTNEAIEFCHSKMFLLHEKNYIYQFFSCISPSVQNSISYSNVNPSLKIPEESVINLLFSLEKSISDNLKVLDLMKSSKPLCPLDPTTSDQFGRNKIEYCIQLAVMAISYQASRNQCLSTLIILHAILPAYVDRFVEPHSDFTTKEVFDVINYLQSIISSCSFLKIDVEAMSRATSNRKETKMNFLDKVSSTVRSVRKNPNSGMSTASANYIRGFIGPLINPQPSEVQQAIQNSLVCTNAILSLSAKVIGVIKKKCKYCDFNSILTSENLNCLLDMAVGIVNVGTKYYEVIDMIGLKSFLRYILPCIQMNAVHSQKVNSLIEIIDSVFQSLVSYPDLVGKTDNNILAKFLCDLSFGINENQDLRHSSCVVNLMISISKVISLQYASYDESYKHCSLEMCSYAVELASYLIGYSNSSFQFSHIFVLSLEESTPDYVLDCILVFWFLPLLIQLAPNVDSPQKPSLKSSCVPFVLNVFNILLNQLIFHKTGKTKSQINSSFQYNVHTYKLPSLQGLPSKFKISNTFESLLSLGFKILLSLHSNNLKNFWACVSSFLSDFIIFGQVDQVFWDLIEFILSSYNPLLLSLSHMIIKLKYLSDPSISNKIPEQIVDLASPSGQSGLISRSSSDNFVILLGELKNYQEKIHHNLVSRNPNSY